MQLTIAYITIAIDYTLNIFYHTKLHHYRILIQLVYMIILIVLTIMIHVSSRVVMAPNLTIAHPLYSSVAITSYRLTATYSSAYYIILYVAFMGYMA